MLGARHDGTDRKAAFPLRSYGGQAVIEDIQTVCDPCGDINYADWYNPAPGSIKLALVALTAGRSRQPTLPERDEIPGGGRPDVWAAMRAVEPVWSGVRAVAAFFFTGDERDKRRSEWMAGARPDVRDHAVNLCPRTAEIHQRAQAFASGA